MKHGVRQHHMPHFSSLSGHDDVEKYFSASSGAPVDAQHISF